MLQLLANFSVLDWLIQFTFVTLLLIVFYFVGCLISGNKKTVSTNDLFFHLLLGLISCIVLYSLIICIGKSIFLLSIPIILMLLFQKKEKDYSKNIELSSHKIHLLFITFLALIFTFKSSLFYFFQSIYPDYSFYAKISYYLNLTGQENEFHIFNIYSTKYHGITPYHYFELWLNSFVNFTQNNFQTSLKNFLCITTSIIDVVLVAGVFALISSKQISKKYIQSILLALIITTIGGINIIEFFNIKILNDFNHVFASVFSYNEAKFCAPLLFLCAVQLKFREGEYAEGFLYASLLPIMNFIITPALLIAISAIFIYLNIFRKKYNLTSSKFFINYGLFLFTSIFILGIYNTSLSSSIARDSAKISDALRDIITHVDNLRVMVNIIGASILSLIYLLFIWVVPLLLVKETRIKIFLLSKEEKVVLLFFILLLFGGAFSWSLLHNTLNSVQLFSITARSFILIMGIFIAAKFLNEILTNKLLKFSYIIILFLSYYTTSVTFKEQIQQTTSNQSSNQFLKDFFTIINKENNQKIAFIRNSSDYKDPYACYPNFSIPLSEIGKISSSITPISISEIDAFPCEEERCRKGLQLGLFYNFVFPLGEFQPKSENEINEYKSNFLIQNDIHFLLRTGNAKLILSEKIKIRLLLKDLKTGYELYRLEFNKGL